MRITLILLLIGVFLIASVSCETKNINEGPIPVVTVPAGMAGGVNATWTVTWTGGVGPYTVTWNFGGGATNAGPVAGTSPATTSAAMVNAGATDATYTYSISVTDSAARTGTASGTYTVAPNPNAAPTIDNVTFAANVLTVDVSDADGDAVTVSLAMPAGLAADAASKIAAQVFSGSATFAISAEDTFAGGNGTIAITADDGNGGTDTADEAVTVTGITLAADVLYAIPLVASAATGETVTVVVATGPVGNFQFLNGVGLCVEDDADYVAATFNAGAVGGAAGDADGAWTTMAPGSGFLLPPDNLIQATDIGGGRERWDFNLTPIGGSDITADGALFNFGFDFSAAGTKTLGFQEVSGVNRTYYSNGASTEAFWPTLMADETGTLDAAAAGINNVITIS